MNKTRNAPPPAVFKDAIGVLNQTVAELFYLFARIKPAHWNVRGTIFTGWHKLLDEFAGKIMIHLDPAAALGGTADWLTDILRPLEQPLWRPARLNRPPLKA